jgi:aryl-alcohol dehydrogenase-like predicted oxidoreductase
MSAMKIDYKKKVILGKTGVEIERLVFGTSSFGGFLRLLDMDDVLAVGRALVRRFGMSITWDSANMYGAGTALENTGNLIRMLGIQEKAEVINKPGWVIVDPPPGVAIDKFEPGLWRGLTKTVRYAQTRAQMRESIDQGVELLGPTIKARLCSAHDFHKLAGMLSQAPDLFLGHHLLTHDVSSLIYDQLLPALAEKRAEGTIEGVGLGMMDWRLAREVITRSGMIDYVMLANEFTILRHDPELLDFTEWLREQGIGLISAAPYNAGWVFAATQNVDGFTDPRPDQLRWRARFLQICKEMMVEPATVALQFVFSNPCVDAVAPGLAHVRFIDINFPRDEDGSDYAIPGAVWKRLIEEGIIRNDYRYKEQLLS